MQFPTPGGSLAAMLTSRPKLVCCKRRMLIAVMLLAGALSGCSRVITLNAAHYLPQLDAAPLANYRGAALLMRGFENIDDNTTIFYYPRSAARIYGGPALTSYFWYCFRSAFEQIGVRIFEEGRAPADLAVMDVRLVRLDESNFTVDVRLLGPGMQPMLQKRYATNGPPLTSLEIGALEQRAYQMMTSLFVKIVSDPEFQAVAVPSGRAGAFVGLPPHQGAAPAVARSP